MSRFWLVLFSISVLACGEEVFQTSSSTSSSNSTTSSGNSSSSGLGGENEGGGDLTSSSSGGTAAGGGYGGSSDGGGGESSNDGGGGSEVVAPVCTPLETRCDNTTVETCLADGSGWISTLCPFACAGGACSGSCTPGDERCQGLTTEHCDSSGSWVVDSTCPFVCDEGSCVGECVPETTRCAGDGVETCDTSGQWGIAVPCEEPTNSESTCSNGACGWECLENFDDCNSDASDGCEIMLGSLNHCESCGDSCPAATAPNTSATCDETCGVECVSMFADCDADPANGCEKEVASDRFNCGGCGNFCRGGFCAGGVCLNGVEEVVQTFGLTSFELDSYATASSLVWTEATGDVRSAPAQAVSTSVLVAMNTDGARAVQTDGTSIYWATDNDIKKASMSGGPASVVVAGHSPVELTLNDDTLWWLDQTEYEPCLCSTPKFSFIWKAPKAGGAAAIENGTNVQTQAFASWPKLRLNDSYIFRLRWGWAPAYTSINFHNRAFPTQSYALLDGYFDSQTNTNIEFYEGSHLAQAPNGTLVWLANWSGVYFSGGDDGRTAFRLTEAGTPVDQFGGVAATNTHVYVIHRPAGLRWWNIVKYPLTQDAIGEVIATNQWDPTHIRVDDTHVYWHSKGYKYSDSVYDVPDMVADEIVRAPN